ncbi:MAG: TolC family protein [Spirochaetes bacterium]|nr:TolC family protein [Spirochaetota bacterium]
MKRLLYLSIPLSLFIFWGVKPCNAQSRSLAGGSDPALGITVLDAIFSALKNNPSLNAQRYAPPIRQTFEKEEWGAFDPTLTAGSTVKDDATGTGSLSLSWPLPTGTRPSVSFSGERRTPTSQIPYKASATYSIGVTQSLLQGGPSLEVNLARVQAARIDTFASQWELKGFTETLVFNVEKAYWEYYLALRQAEIYRDSLRIAEQQLENTRQRIAVGRLPELELAASQVEVAQRKESLIGAEARVESARLKLLQYIAQGTFQDVPVLLREEPKLPDEGMDEVGKHVEVGMKKRSDLITARLSREKGDLEVIRTRNGLLPKLDFFIFLGNTVYKNALGDAATALFSTDPTLSAGISFSMPLGNRAAEARARRATLSRAQMDEAIGNLERAAEVEIRSAFTEVKRARATVFATSETRRLQEEKLRSEQEKYQVGRSTSILVATAERDLLSARLTEAQAVVNYILAVLNLYKAEGTLLERRGIDAEPIPLP